MLRTHSIKSVLAAFIFVSLVIGQVFVAPATLMKAISGDSISSPISVPVSVPGGTPVVVNLVDNGSFEVNNAGYPASWWKRPYGSYDNKVAHSGVASLKLTATPTTYKDGIYSQQYITLKPATKYTLKYWAKTQNVTGWGVGMRYAQLQPTTQVFYMPWVTGFVKGTQDWKQYTYTFTTPVNYQSGRLDVMWKIDSGTAWIDDVVLTK